MGRWIDSVSWCSQITREFGPTKIVKHVNKDVCSMRVFAVNCTVEPEGLCPALLVFSAILRAAGTMPASLQVKKSEPYRSRYGKGGKRANTYKNCIWTQTWKRPNRKEQFDEISIFTVGKSCTCKNICLKTMGDLLEVHVGRWRNCWCAPKRGTQDVFELHLWSHGKQPI